MRVRTQLGGRSLWLGAGEGLAKAREELTRARQDHPSENWLSSSNNSRVSTLRLIINN